MWNDNTDVNQEALANDEAGGFLAVYDAALPHVYGYLSRAAEGARSPRTSRPRPSWPRWTRCAPDDARTPVSVPWLIGVARHKLVDHWRRARRAKSATCVPWAGGSPSMKPTTWDVRLDAVRARRCCLQLSPVHRAVLTLRYLDDLSVPAVAEMVDRSVHATEGLLVRARSSLPARLRR